MKRVITDELLDTDAGTPEEIASSLEDLQRINLWFGGIATSAELVRRVADEVHASSLSLLEVAAGSGYVPESVKSGLRNQGIYLRVTLLDRALSHLNYGRQSVVGDALALPFRDATFDVVSCNLFAHHLSPDELVKFVDDGLRVCRVAVLINDLIRKWLHLSLVYAGLPLYRSRLTRHDAPASVRQAYTPEEMKAVLGQTQASRVEIRNHYLFRMGAIAWKAKG